MFVRNYLSNKFFINLKYRTTSRYVILFFADAYAFKDGFKVVPVVTALTASKNISQVEFLDFSSQFSKVRELVYSPVLHVCMRRDKS